MDWADIPGRHVVDTLLLVQSYDMVRRSMESHGLKEAARHFGLARPDRVHIPGERISWHWDHDPDPLVQYALDDVEETQRLSERLSGSSFYLSRMVPLPLGTVVRSGAAAKIESLLLRAYLREKVAIPAPAAGSQTGGGYTDMFLTGVVGPVVHVDVESLYPSLMITRGIRPASDTLGAFPALLGELTALRLDVKRRMRESPEGPARSGLDALQSSFKILINSFYGYLGYARGLFNDPAQADAVTRAGQETLRAMMTAIADRGGTVVEVDTDGVFFIPPPDAEGEAGEEEFVRAVGSTLPQGISVVSDGRYARMLSYKKKNYALLGHDGAITLRGSSLISRSMERFGRMFIRACVEHLLRGDVAGLHRVYVETEERIRSHRLDVSELVRTETLHETIHEYEEGVRSGRRNRSAAYEVARMRALPVRPGDRVAFYVAGTDPAPRSFESCRPAEEWDPNFPDENTAYYLRRLEEYAEKFSPFFLPQDYRAVFSADDLFPFNPEGIRPVVAPVRGTVFVDEDAEETEP
jgi:DNA polymerase elongation subunit (family B)